MWMLVTAVLTRASMTLFHVPHLALGSELSTDYNERSNIATLQNVFARIGAGLAGGLGLLVFLRATNEFPDGRFNAAAYPQFAFTLSLLMFAAVVLSAWNTRSRIPYLSKPDAEAVRRVVGLPLLDAIAVLAPEMPSEAHASLEESYREAFGARRQSGKVVWVFRHGHA